MKRRDRIPVITQVLLVTSIVSSCGGEASPIDEAYFARPDSRIPELSIAYTEERSGGVVVESASYPGTGGAGVVDAFIVVPPGGGTGPAVLYMHWGGGSRYEFLGEAVLLAESGVVSLLVGLPYAETADHYRRALFDLWTGLDLLAARSDVDPARLGYVGHSWGATFGVLLGILDDRIETLVLMAGVPSMSEFFSDESFAPFDAETFIASVDATIFFQVADADAMVTEAMSRRLYEAASQPKRTATYSTTHPFVNSEAQADRIDWLLEHL